MYVQHRILFRKDFKLGTKLGWKKQNTNFNPFPNNRITATITPTFPPSDSTLLKRGDTQEVQELLTLDARYGRVRGGKTATEEPSP